MSHELMFRLSHGGSMLRGAHVYTLGRMKRAYYDSLVGLLRASFLAVEEPAEEMEDGSLAPWANLRVCTTWPGGSTTEEVVCSENFVPEEALLKDQKIAPFRWRRRDA